MRPIQFVASVKSCFFILGCLSFLSGCQLVKVQQNQLSLSLSEKTDHILTNQVLSETSRNFLFYEEKKPEMCLEKIDQCIHDLQKNQTLDLDQFYAVASELYMAKAMHIDSKKNPNLHLKYLDRSLRYSYVYLFHSQKKPEARVFDLRQIQVRSLYNVALSQLITTSYQKANYQEIPQKLVMEKSYYFIDISYYPALKNAKIDQLKSSYNLNFSGLNNINRQEGLGAEFVFVKAEEKHTSHPFILNPIEYFQHQSNPNIHSARYLPMSSTAQPRNNNASVQDILSGETDFQINLYDPQLYKSAKIAQKEYTLTANYSVPFGLWLADNQLGASGYKGLLNRANNLQMPHLFQLEPYQPNKKIIVMIHGLASSPETWISLTNNIMGDEKLRDNYQVWQVFYSTNMPIFESRFQIHALLQQAFSQVKAESGSSTDAVLIGHSMGGVISRLLVSDADISAQAIPLMNYEQNIQLQRNPIIKERFIFKPLAPIRRAIFIAAPHRGSDLAEKWYVDFAKKWVKLPQTFSNQVDIHLKEKNSTKGMIHSGPDDLAPSSRFMRLTANIQPTSNIIYHSILGNHLKSNDLTQMSDGIVPYSSSHLSHAHSEKVIRGGHSIHETPEAIMELRRILREHLP